MALHPLLRRAFDFFYTSANIDQKVDYRAIANGSESLSSRDTSEGLRRSDMRTSFDVAFNLLFLVALHGTSAPKIMTILYINYMLATRVNRDVVPIFIWVFNVAILFANELAQGYPYARIVGLGDSESRNWGSILDQYGGLQPRWDIHFNVTVLRLISFDFDYLWAKNQSGSTSPIEVYSFVIRLQMMMY